MKRLPIVILVVLAVLGAVVPGCGGAHHYDSRLTAADSLMRDRPDSALRLLEALPHDSLVTEHDRAYRDLLLTQARYRNYITATADSDINCALVYYKRHPKEQEKLTRSYLFKGTVMEELGYPDSAMFYYKQAESVAADGDYLNLGQINIRIGALYRSHYADFQTCYDKYQKALDCYYYFGDKQKELICLYNMGMCSGITGKGNAKQLLDSAAALAIELNDSDFYTMSIEMIVRQLIKTDSAVSEAKQLAFRLLNDYKCYQDSDLFIDIADIYIMERNADSAKYYINQIYSELKPTQDSQLKIRAFNALAGIAALEGNMDDSHKYRETGKHLSDSISNNKLKYRIQRIESSKNGEKIDSILTAEKNRQKRFLWIAILMILIILLPMSVFIIYQYRKVRHVKSILSELNNVTINTHEALLEQLHAKEASIERLVKNMVSFMQTSINTTENDPPSVIRKRIKDTITDVADDDFWDELRAYLDKNHNNIISNIAMNPKINDSDLRFIELACCGFSYIEMAITLGYSTNYVSNKRIKIKRKLNLTIPLEDYLKQAMKA